MYRRKFLPFAALALLTLQSARPGWASDEPTREDCELQVLKAQTLAAALPLDDLSRYFAERHLHQAMVEAGNGEFDECVEYAERAAEEVRERRHTLGPGEHFHVMRPDEIPGSARPVDRR